MSYRSLEMVLGPTRLALNAAACRVIEIKGQGVETLEQLSDRLGVVVTNWTTATMAVAADKRGLTITQGKDIRTIVIESPGGRKIVFRNGWTTWNSPLARRLAKNKEATAALLAGVSIEVPEGHVFKKGEVERAWEFARNWDKSVVKPVNSRQGKDVYAGLDNEETFRAAFDKVAEGHRRILVQEYVSGVERRYLVAGGKVVAVSERRPASVLGDGISTIQELVQSKNQSRPRLHSQLRLDKQALDLLRQEGKDAESVPADGERVFLRSHLNYEREESPNTVPATETAPEDGPVLLEARPVDEGGDFIDRTDEADAVAIRVAEKAVRVMPGARLVGIDLIEPVDQGRAPTVLEINSSPMLSSHYFPAEGKERDVSKDIVDAMFPAPVKQKSILDKMRQRFKVR